VSATDSGTNTVSTIDPKSWGLIDSIKNQNIYVADPTKFYSNQRYNMKKGTGKGMRDVISALRMNQLIICSLVVRWPNTFGVW
jgi:hypothetical protein